MVNDTESNSQTGVYANTDMKRRKYQNSTPIISSAARVTKLHWQIIAKLLLKTYSNDM